MVKNLIAASTIVLMMASANPVSAQKNQISSLATKSEVKFLDHIMSGFNNAFESLNSKISGARFVTPFRFIKNENPSEEAVSIEKASSLQLKFSILLDMEVEAITNIGLLQLIDEWLGTRYIYGGTNKAGIDCSAFAQALYAGLFGFMLPRTAREQHKVTRKVSRTEIQEGDLVFFNTRRGVSHVGIYLQNNKFVHAASSRGVMISDLDNDYWANRFISVGRYDKPAGPQNFFSQP
ncbi:MAG: C40 family peptidase [Chitinophagaceae bacterium]